jgi:hypothetical protein
MESDPLDAFICAKRSRYLLQIAKKQRENIRRKNGSKSNIVRHPFLLEEEIVRVIHSSE